REGRAWANRAPAISGSNRQASRPCSGVARPVIRAVNSVGKGHVPILGSPVGGGVRVSTPIVAGEPFRAYPASATGQVANVLSESAGGGKKTRSDKVLRRTLISTTIMHFYSCFSVFTH